PAPGLFSTMTGWPRVVLRDSAMARPTMSVPPPAGKGTINLIGRAGQASAACAAPAHTLAQHTDATHSSLKRFRNADIEDLRKLGIASEMPIKGCQPAGFLVTALG